MKLRTSVCDYVEHPVKQTTYVVTFMRAGLKFGYLNNRQRYPCRYNRQKRKLDYDPSQCSKEAFNLDFKYSYHFALRVG